MFLPDNIENKDDDGKKYWRIDSFVEQYIYIIEIIISNSVNQFPKDLSYICVILLKIIV